MRADDRIGINGPAALFGELLDRLNLGRRMHVRHRFLANGLE
jgi:hypothetical protein